MKSRRLTTLVASLSLVLLAPLIPGCGDGDTAPTPSSKPSEEIRKEQENIMRKEYGSGVDKARKN